jgi:hypothetical protein
VSKEGERETFVLCKLYTKNERERVQDALSESNELECDGPRKRATDKDKYKQI